MGLVAYKCNCRANSAAERTATSKSVHRLVGSRLFVFSSPAPASAYEEHDDADQEQAKGCDEDEVGEQSE